MNIVIIEDERKAALELRDILTAISSQNTVVAMLESVESSIEWFRENDSPSVIFADIQLGDGLSFEIFKALKHTAPVIFCTAFDEYMLDAFDANGIQYLLKPITRAKVQRSLDHYISLRETFTKDGQKYLEDLKQLFQVVKPVYRSTILVNFKDKIIPVRADEIAFLYSNQGVLAVGLMNQQTYFVNDTLDEFEKTLDPNQFFRANRQFIVHRNSIRDIERYFSRKHVLKLKIKTPEEIVVSKVKSSALLEWLQQL